MTDYQFQFTVSTKYRMPLNFEFPEVMSHIGKFPIIDDPEIYGLDQNCTLKTQLNFFK